MFPNLQEEKKFRKKGYKIIVGLDEAGRGALAGPVVAAAVLLKKNLKSKSSVFFLREVKDSKQLSPRQREKLYQLIIKSKNIQWGIGMVSEKVIDKINILESTKLAMIKAVKNLERKIRRRIEVLILDGNFILSIKYLVKLKIDSNIIQKSIKKADIKVLSCACASILAKTFRDRLMKKENKKYPKYKFTRHKGYGTKFHFKVLKKYGPCKIHRKTFRPIKNKSKIS